MSKIDTGSIISEYDFGHITIHDTQTFKSPLNLSTVP